MHRPDFAVGGIEPFVTLPKGIEEERPGMWISYAPLEDVRRSSANLVRLKKHRPLAFAMHPWEQLKIGGGTPPAHTEHGWLMVYHGLSGHLELNLEHQPDVYYGMADARVGVCRMDLPNRLR